MKNKITIIVLAMSFVVLCQAHQVQAGCKDGICPIKALSHADELSLTKKQVAGLKKVKNDFMAQKEAMHKKMQKDVKAILSDEQIKQYHKITETGSTHKKKHGEKEADCKGKDNGETCSVKEHHKKHK